MIEIVDPVIPSIVCENIIIQREIVRHDLYLSSCGTERPQEDEEMAETLDVTSMLNVAFEPKRKNRWVLMIEGIDAYIVKTAKRPQMTIEEVPIPFMNSHRYVAGKPQFSTVAITLHDPIAPSGAQQVMEWIRLHYESVSGRAGYADFYKRDADLKLVDPIGTIIEMWRGKGVMITDCDFGELTYEDHGLVEIALTLRGDNWILDY